MENQISIKSSNEKEEVKHILDKLGPKQLREIIMNKLTHGEIKNKFKEKNNSTDTNTNTNTNLDEEKQMKLKKSANRTDFSKMKSVAFKFMYIGTNYEGLVIQNHTNNTIEHKILSAFELAHFIESPEKSNYSRCGRTDAGVSATGNVFNLNVRYKPEKEIDYLNSINNILPKDIILWGIADVDKAFDSRFCCLYREYKYFFLKKNMNLELMKKAAKKLQGFHNFKNFCKIDKSIKDTTKKTYDRRIYEYKIENYEKFSFPYNQEKTSENDFFDMCVVTIKGSAFLWHQVRCMMSIIFYIGKGLEDLSIIDEMFKSESGKIFHYDLASDLPLILSNCEYEDIEFRTDMNVCGHNYFKLIDIHERNIIQNYMSSFSIDYLTNIIKTSKDLSNKYLSDEIDLSSNRNESVNENEKNLMMINIFESKYRRKQNYKKMLSHKINRNNNKK